MPNKKSKGGKKTSKKGSKKGKKVIVFPVKRKNSTPRQHFLIGRFLSLTFSYLYRALKFGKFSLQISQIYLNAHSSRMKNLKYYFQVAAIVNILS